MRHRRAPRAARPRSAALEAAGWEVVVPELPGFDGRSGFTPPDDHLGWLTVVWDALDATGALPCPVVGASVGGMLAADLAALRPEAVNALALLAPFGIFDEAHPGLDLYAVPTAERMGHLFAKGVPEPFVDRFSALGPDEGPVARYLSDVAAASLLWPLGDRGQAGRLHRISCPTLVLWGEQDELLPVDVASAWARQRRAGRGHLRRRPPARMGRARRGRRPPRSGSSAITKGCEMGLVDEAEFHFFHFFPYTHLPEDHRRYESLWVDFSNANYDPQIGHDLYTRYLSEMVLADQLGYDGIVLNEHHNTQYSMNPAPNLTAAALIPQTKGWVSVFGTPPNLGYPNRLAEEYAMLDVMSGGRLRIAFPLGTGMEYWANAVNPATARARFRESIDIILRCWTEDGPQSYSG